MHHLCELKKKKKRKYCDCNYCNKKYSYYCDSNSDSDNHEGTDLNNQNTFDTQNSQEFQIRPISLGVSGSSIKSQIFDGKIAIKGCAGTLGSLVTKNGKYYILSNTHVFAGDTTLGTNDTVAKVGDPIIQPGLLDLEGTPFKSKVAELSEWQVVQPFVSNSPIYNIIDAAIAEVSSNNVNITGPIVHIGTINPTPLNPVVGMSVMKSGRTTGLTHGSILAVNVTVAVGYSPECGSSTTFVARFNNQIVVRGNGFSKGGDSGSLVVEQLSKRPVGLLYAGNNRDLTALCPIPNILNRFGVQFVGSNTSSPFSVSNTSAGIGQLSTSDITGYYTVSAVKDKHCAEMMSNQNIVAMGIDISNHHKPCIVVFAKEDDSSIPEKMDDITVVKEMVGNKGFHGL